MKKNIAALVIAGVLAHQSQSVPRLIYQKPYPKLKVRKDRFIKHGKLTK
ncbi:hypothetical protein [Rodentibacter pneumotropicus]|nr:hypothetical protein [Rodentibacter pneumotropicus]